MFVDSISQYVRENGDPRGAKYPLLDSPWPVLIIVTLYLIMVKYGPMLMINRKAYDLRDSMKVFNLVQILINGFIVIIGIANWSSFKIECIYQSETGWVTDLATYSYYALKYLDMIDTLFFILRKKQNQISFLHVFHHATQPIAVYIIMRIQFLGTHTWGGFVNALVHVVMYGYYLLSAIDTRISTNLRIKKSITIMQLAQFMFLVLVFVVSYHNPRCDTNTYAMIPLFAQACFMLILFSNFYYQTYIKQKPKAKSTKQN